MNKPSQVVNKTKVMIPVKNLSVVWVQSQREWDAAAQRAADRIVAEFDTDYFDDLIVTLPNEAGMHHVIDGQTRRAAIQQMWGDEEMVPCRIVNCKDPARAAEIFDKVNSSRRQLSGLHRFKVRVTAGHETEIAITKVLTMLGYRIEASGGKGSIRAVGALMNVYKSYGLDVMKETLVTIKGTWADDNGAVEAPIIEGFGSLIGAHRGQIDWKRLREKTAQTFTPGRLIGHGKADRELNGGRVADGIRRVLIRNYDQGLRTGKLGG